MSVKKTPPRKKTGALSKAEKNKKASKKKVSKKKLDKAKPAIKKAKKKKVATKKNNTKKVNKKELKKAVEKLPGLIVEKAKLAEKKEVIPSPTTEKPRDVIEIRELKPTGETKTRVGQNYDDGRDKKWLMWVGVIIFTAVILALWGWNLIVKVQDSAKIDDLGIIKDVKENVTEILDNPSEEIDLNTKITEEDQEEVLKEKIKQNITSIITSIKTNELSTNENSAETNPIENQNNLVEKNNNEIITPSL